MYPLFSTDPRLGTVVLLLAAPGECAAAEPLTAGWGGGCEEDADTSAAALHSHSLVQSRLSAMG